MATIKRFEEIRAWQVARELARLVYAITQGSGFSKDFGLRDQVRRAVVSVGSNIAEGFARNGNKEFVKFLWIAKGSAAEVQSQFYAALDAGYVTEEQRKMVYDKAEDCATLIYRFIEALRDSPFDGDRYKSRPPKPLPPPKPLNS